MAGRGTNLALLALLGVALATGGLAFALGTALVRVPVVAHGAAGLGVLLLVPWKWAIVRRGLRRRPGSWVSLAFTLVLAVCVAAGVGHSTGLLRSVGGVTAMQLHVGAALASVPLGLWHVAARRVRPRRTDLSRRALLRAGLLAAGSLVAYGALAGLVRVARLPGRARRFTGSFEVGSYRPRAMPVVQWLDDPVPAVDPAAWELRVVVPGAGVRRLSLGELEARREPVLATLDCTGGWFARQRWEGVRLSSLLGSASGRSVTVRSVTGYWRRFPLADADRLWLAIRVGGEPLSAGHGFPARLVAPGRRGYWWVKWVREVEVSEVPWWWQPPYPLS